MTGILYLFPLAALGRHVEIPRTSREIYGVLERVGGRVRGAVEGTGSLACGRRRCDDRAHATLLESTRHVCIHGYLAQIVRGDVNRIGPAGLRGRDHAATAAAELVTTSANTGPVGIGAAGRPAAATLGYGTFIRYGADIQGNTGGGRVRQATIGPATTGLALGLPSRLMSRLMSRLTSSLAPRLFRLSRGLLLSPDHLTLLLRKFLESRFKKTNDRGRRCCNLNGLPFFERGIPHDLQAYRRLFECP